MHEAVTTSLLMVSHLPHHQVLAVLIMSLFEPLHSAPHLGGTTVTLFTGVSLLL